ncbi:peptidoglycan-binding protein [Nocardioides antri]|uniref:Efflux RND transporter periplasmic adaptor subunit n=1 Tax=Nocardioides antri TaxID=2607659 RepID=A0A5B1M8I8_9ACTN|nr:peptidoglycan-binding protein [Nocardioides antri]KAA1428766.1 efflux RND transporter periplasmic adaptor subunit [Nocardioides antri]
MAAISGVGIAYAVGQDSSGQAKASPTGGTATAPVERGDLVMTETLDGTLGYADQRPITGKVAGTITGLPAKGAVVRRGQGLYAVDGQSIFLMYGKVPAYRTITVGSEGDDVLQLERNLRAMGYGEDLEVDQTYTSYTASAVRDWQEDEGLSETGEITWGSVVFEPGPVRVADHETTVGSGTGPGQPVITASGLGRVVNVDLPVEQRSLARKSAEVQVTLPDGQTAAGRVTSVGNVAKTSGGEQGEEEETTIEVNIDLVEPGAAGNLDAAPVDVTFQSERRKDVLSVPVNGLMALPEGGYAVVVVENGASRTVKVELGVFAAGRVEVTGPGLQAGMDVEVPAS